MKYTVARSILNATLTLFLMTLGTSSTLAQTPVSLELIERFHELNLNIPLEEQREPLEELLNEAQIYRDANTDDPGAWIACGLIQASYGRARGISGLGNFKDARANFETAIELDDRAFSGYSQAFLGRLYVQLPSWPLSYGSNKKALELLQTALQIDPNSGANKYYYGVYLIENEEYQEAVQYLESAKSGPPPSSNAPFWQASILKSLEEDLQSIQGKL